MITKWKTSDEFPGSISLPFGIKTSHTWHEIGQILRIINDEDVVQFVEVGTHVGGLASIISCVNKYRPFIYRGIEINESVVDDRVKDAIRFGDALDVRFAGQSIKNNVGKTMIYCDGGNKVKEMRLYAKLISRGDIIACHDYYDGQEVDGLPYFGEDDGACGCNPEVWRENLSAFWDGDWTPLATYLVEGTRIVGFVKQ